MEQTCEKSSAAVAAFDDDVQQRCERLQKSIAKVQEERHNMGLDTYDDFMRFQESEHRQQIEKQQKQDVKQLKKFQEKMDQHLGGHFELVDKPTKHFKFEFSSNGDGTTNFEATRVVQKVLKFIKVKKEPKRLRKPKKDTKKGTRKRSHICSHTTGLFGKTRINKCWKYVPSVDITMKTDCIIVNKSY